MTLSQALARARPRRRAGPAARRAWRLAFLGDLAVDVVLAAEAPLAGGTDVPGTVRFRAGGSAANAARWTARLGGRATFIGAVGRDGWGRRLVAALRAEGVTVRVVRVPGLSARIGVVVAPGGERSFVADRLAADRLTAEVLRPAWLAVDLLHLPAYSLLAEPLAGAAARAVDLARGQGALVSLDLASRGPLLAHGRRDAWHRLERVGADLLLGNSDETAALVGVRGPRALLELAPVVCMKRGAEGCSLWARAGGRTVDPVTLEVLAAPVTTTETTGAGDAFDAGFLLAWLDGRAAGVSLPVALRRAALAGNRAAARHLLGTRGELAP